MYATLSAIVIFDLFPYPDIMCKYLDCQQSSTVQIILDLLLKTLTGVEVDTNLAMDACNGRDFILSLKFRYGHGMDELASEVPARIRLFTKILGDWQSFTAGG